MKAMKDSESESSEQVSLGDENDFNSILSHHSTLNSKSKHKLPKKLI